MEPVTFRLKRTFVVLNRPDMISAFYGVPGATKMEKH